MTTHNDVPIDEVSRRTFLQKGAALLAGLAGLAGLGSLRSLGESQQRTGGYGASSYGGKRRQSSPDTDNG